MAKMTAQQRAEIVLALARFIRPTEIKKMMFDEYGLELDLPQITMLNPLRTTYSGGEEFVTMFHEERKRYIEQVTEVPIANQGFRLQELQKNYKKASDMGNLPLASQILKQAAEEVGGVMTNERSVNVTDQRRRNMDDMTPDERREFLSELITEAMSSSKGNAATTMTEQ